jgi:hypothetical protein
MKYIKAIGTFPDYFTLSGVPYARPCSALKPTRRPSGLFGLISADWVGETLAESPFYAGWEALWRKEIGFDI